MKNVNRHINNVDYWQADILSAYDYSPFGVMLSGRTFEKEETIQVCHNETTLTTTPVLEEGFGSWGSWNAINSALLTYVNGEMQVSNPSNSSNNIGASKTFVTGSGVHSVSFDIIDNTCATIVLWPPSVTPKTINVYIRDNANNIVASGAYTTAGNYSLSFTPATTGATYKIEFYMTSASAFCYYRIDDVLITYQSEQITQVCENVSKKGKYRYAFQSQERDDEIKGAGNSYNYTYRMHDSRLGRFFAVDLLAGQYPHNSTYAFSENRLIDAFELEGLEKVHIGGHWYDFTNKDETYIRGTLSMLEKYHQGHLTYKRVSNWQKHWRVEVKGEYNFWMRSKGTEISIYKSKADYENDKPFYHQTERDISQKIVNTLEPGAGGGKSDPAQTGYISKEDKNVAKAIAVIPLTVGMTILEYLYTPFTGPSVFGPGDLDVMPSKENNDDTFLMN